MGETNSYLNSPLLRVGRSQYKVVRAEPCNAGMKFTLKPVVPSCIEVIASRPETIEALVERMSDHYINDDSDCVEFRVDTNGYANGIRFENLDSWHRIDSAVICDSLSEASVTTTIEVKKKGEMSYE